VTLYAVYEMASLLGPSKMIYASFDEVDALRVAAEKFMRRMEPIEVHGMPSFRWPDQVMGGGGRGGATGMSAGGSGGTGGGGRGTL